jgi:hypothetical protein
LHDIGQFSFDGFLSFDGWSRLRKEVRGRNLARSLSPVSVGEHGTESGEKRHDLMVTPCVFPPILVVLVELVGRHGLAELIDGAAERSR